MVKSSTRSLIQAGIKAKRFVNDRLLQQPDQLVVLREKKEEFREHLAQFSPTHSHTQQEEKKHHEEQNDDLSFGSDCVIIDLSASAEDDFTS